MNYLSLISRAALQEKKMLKDGKRCPFPLDIYTLLYSVWLML